MDPLRRWTHAAALTGVRVCACVYDSRRYVHVRALQLQDPPNRLPTRLVDTNTTPWHRLQHRTGAGGGEEETSSSSSHRPGGNTAALLSFVLRPSFPRLSAARTRRGYARSNAEVTHAHTHARAHHTPIDRPIAPRRFETAIRISPREVYGVASRTMHLDNFGPRFSSRFVSSLSFFRLKGNFDRLKNLYRDYWTIGDLG